MELLLAPEVIAMCHGPMAVNDSRMLWPVTATDARSITLPSYAAIEPVEQITHSVANPPYAELHVPWSGLLPTEPAKVHQRQAAVGRGF